MALTDTFVKQAKWGAVNKAGDKHSDGGGMHLLVKATGKYWRLDYRFHGKQKTLALGVYPDVSLLKARKRRADARELLADGKDPAEAKRETQTALVAASKNTFEAVGREWHAMKAKSTGPVTTAKRLMHLERHIFPVIGARPVDAIKPAEILGMLKATAASGTAYTAGRLRELCGGVFRYAIQTSRAVYDPAASMIGAIEQPPVAHRPALTTRREFGEFLRDLHTTATASPLTMAAARFGLLTWTRPGELRQGRWEQIDWDAKEWRIPALAMKTGKHLQAHTVPLSPQALIVLQELRSLSGHTDRLFPSTHSAHGVISENTVNGLFKRMGYQGRQSHHGLRASARSLLSERGWGTEALERQLDHKEANKAIAAYARSQHLAERRKFMDDWGSLVETLVTGSNVVPLMTAA